MPTNSPDPWQAFTEFCEQFGGPTFSVALQEALGLRAIASLLRQSDRGNTTAAKYLCDRWLGQPEMPFSARIEGMTEAEVREALLERTRAGLRRVGLAESFAEGMLPRGDEEDDDDDAADDG